MANTILPPMDSNADNQSTHDEIWGRFNRFYSKNEKTIQRCMDTDMRALGEGGQASEIEQINSFLETTKIVLDGLAELGKIYPIIGGAVVAFHAVVSLDWRSRHNSNKMVIVVMVEMQNMMCAMFQLRTYVNDHKRDEENSYLDRLVKSITADITQCESDINYYLAQKFVLKIIEAKIFEAHFKSHAETFSMHRAELHTAIKAYMHGNTFFTRSKAEPSLDILYKRVAPNAILNAGGRGDEVRCHPGTCGDVLGRIEKWKAAQEGLTASILWLSGPAGAGKSAIVQTIAERCRMQSVPQANFFFFQTDNSRNTASSLVATILYQIVGLYPSIREMVEAVLFGNPLIFDSVLELQLEELIVAPLHRVQRDSASYQPLVLLIDSLDECDSETDQRRILHAFGKALAEHSCPFRLLVASRAGPQITMLFNQLSPSLLSLSLDHKYSVNCDIRLFVTSEFKRVRRTHSLGHTLPETWPSAADIDGIVQKSSGQFSYAAMVMRTILNSSDNPKSSLEELQGIAQITSSSSFSHADAIDTYILSRADDQQALGDILHAHFLRTRPTFPEPTTGAALHQTLSFYDRILRLVQ